MYRNFKFLFWYGWIYSFYYSCTQGRYYCDVSLSNRRLLPQIWLPLCSPVSLRALLYREPFMSDFELSQVCPDSLCALGFSNLSLCCVRKCNFCKEHVFFSGFALLICLHPPWMSYIIHTLLSHYFNVQVYFFSFWNFCNSVWNIFHDYIPPYFQYLLNSEQTTPAGCFVRQQNVTI